MRRLALVMLVLIAAPGVAQTADSLAKAREAYQAGQALYKDGRYREAAARFEEANFLSPRAGNWFNIARCYEQVNEVPKALAAFRSFLREAPTTPDKAEVQASIARLQGQLKASGVQQLTVLVEPKDARATISVDGRLVGVAPGTIELPKGTHKVAVEAPGFSSAERRVDLTLEAAIDVTLTLTPSPSTPPLSPVTPVTPVVVAPPGDAPLQPGVGAVGEPPPPPPLVPVVSETTRKPYVFAWVGTALTAVAVGVGVVLYLVASGVQTSLQSPPSGTPRSHYDNQALYDQGVGMQTGSLISYGVAGGLGITTVLLFILEGK